LVISMYGRGYKYCSGCMMYIRTKGRRCPYCGKLLRSRPARKKEDEKKYVVVPDEVLLDI